MMVANIKVEKVIDPSEQNLPRRGPPPDSPSPRVQPCASPTSNSINNNKPTRTSKRQTAGHSALDDKRRRLNEEEVVKICAFSKQWTFPKQMLRQSEYLRQKLEKAGQPLTFNLQIKDSNITVDALEFAFNYMHYVEHPLGSQEVVPILAAALFLQLPHLIEMCCEKVKETEMHCDKAIALYNVAEIYGHEATKRLARGRLEKEFMSKPKLPQEAQEQYVNTLKCISPKLMGELVSSPDVTVLGGEYKMYKVLKLWLFSKLKKEGQKIACDKFFEKTGWQKPLLETEEGEMYKEPFRALKMMNLLKTYQPESEKKKFIYKMLGADRILPKAWITEASVQLFQIMHQVKAHDYTGPTAVSEERFEKEAMRFSYANKDLNIDWYEEDFLFGLNLTFKPCKQSFTVMRRNASSLQEKEPKRPMNVMALHPTYNVFIKVDYKFAGQNGLIQRVITSGIQKLALRIDEEIEVLKIEEEVPGTLCVSVKLLAHVADQ